MAKPNQTLEDDAHDVFFTFDGGQPSVKEVIKAEMKKAAPEVEMRSKDFIPKQSHADRRRDYVVGKDFEEASTAEGWAVGPVGPSSQLSPASLARACPC